MFPGSRTTEMSNTYIADSTDDTKSDDTLIIIVNADGTLSVDPETLQKLIGMYTHCIYLSCHVLLQILLN